MHSGHYPAAVRDLETEPREPDDGADVPWNWCPRCKQTVDDDMRTGEFRDGSEGTCIGCKTVYVATSWPDGSWTLTPREEDVTPADEVERDPVAVHEGYCGALSADAMACTRKPHTDGKHLAEGAPGDVLERWTTTAERMTEDELAMFAAYPAGHCVQRLAAEVRALQAELAARPAPAADARFDAVFAKWLPLLAPYLNGEQQAALRADVLSAASASRPRIPLPEAAARFTAGHVQRLRDGTWEWSPDGGFDQGVYTLSADVSAFLNNTVNAIRPTSPVAAPAANASIEARAKKASLVYDSCGNDATDSADEQAWIAVVRAVDASRPAPSLDREALGRIVREVWIAWAYEQAAPKPSWLVPWEGLSECDREVDRRIGERIAREALASDHAIAQRIRSIPLHVHDFLAAELARILAHVATLPAWCAPTPPDGMRLAALGGECARCLAQPGYHEGSCVRRQARGLTEDQARAWADSIAARMIYEARPDIRLHRMYADALLRASRGRGAPGFGSCLDRSGEAMSEHLARFWAHVDRRGPLECWPWKGGRRSRTGRRHKGTYGGVWLNGRMVLAHRVALFGVEPRPEMALHTCDNPLCCNPAHLFAGSQLANVHDQLAKGRWTRSRGVDGRFTRTT